jgi:hypothetical protein
MSNAEELLWYLAGQISILGFGNTVKSNMEIEAQVIQGVIEQLQGCLQSCLIF